jgi:hypothetical protein
MDDEFDKCLELIDSMLESPKELDWLIRQFQQIVWNVPHDKEDKPWEVLRDLAYDLDFYEPDPIRRAKDYSFYDKDRALTEIKTAKDKLNEVAKL